MRGLVLLSTLWVLLVLAHHGEGRVMFADVATSKPVPCNWVCGLENMNHCECIPFQAQQEGLLRSGGTSNPSAATVDPTANDRIFGIPGTIIGRTLLQVGPGLTPGVITTLELHTAVQVMCRKSDILVQDDPWWLKVHVLQNGQEGWVSDFWVDCSQVGNCNVPFCV